MGILITVIIAGVVLVAVSTISNVVQSLWLNTVGTYLAVFESNCIGRIIVQPYFTWIISVALFLLALRILSRAKV